MPDKLAAIDISMVDELRKTNEEQEVLERRLVQMEEKRETVSPVVYDRVRADYQSQHAALEDRANSLKEKGRREYAKLRAIYEKAAADLETARLDREELELRHELGEFEEKAFEERLDEADERLKERDLELSEIEKLKCRFIEVFGSEEELEARAEDESAGCSRGGFLLSCPPQGPVESIKNQR